MAIFPAEPSELPRPTEASSRPGEPEVYRSAAIRFQRYREVKLGVRAAAVSFAILLGIGGIMMSAQESLGSCLLSVPSLFALTGLAAASAGTAIELVRVLFSRRAPGMVLVSDRGIYLCRGARPIRLPFASIQRVLTQGDEVTLFTRTDDVVRIRIADDAVRARLAGAVTDPSRALPRGPLPSGEPRYPEAIAALLGQRDRPPAAWRSELSPLSCGAPESYRQSFIDAGDAAVVLEDERAPAELRIGAALLLSRAEDEVMAERLRVAVCFCRDRALRDALAAAAYGELDDALLSEALGRRARA